MYGRYKLTIFFFCLICDSAARIVISINRLIRSCMYVLYVCNFSYDGIFIGKRGARPYTNSKDV